MRSTKFIAVFTLIILAITFLYFFYKEGTLAVDKNEKSTKIFVIKPGESLNNIVKNLSREGLIRNSVVFYFIIKQKGIEKKIQAGDFRLSPSMNADEIAETLTHGTLDVWVTIIEGLRKEEVAQIFSKSLDIPEVEFISQSEEGYLFPDTYLIPRQATAGGIIDILNFTFKQRFTNELKTKVKNLELTEPEAVTLASLVEREARSDEARQKVASILLKRLQNEVPLQVDATIQYALGYQPKEKTWWKKNLTLEDLKIKSPYNTYLNTGLPPEPISNPSFSSLNAVANADPSTPYMFYITGKDGKMRYARTLEEHNANIAKYLN
ncbi:MAG: endolytic transglycosylase MltG [Candidatus Roizmanbacteria bacterium]|nr:MAG: endolytic transglycosylase MltG [Candidatus Roizmanbacteria bacterium]